MRKKVLALALASVMMVGGVVGAASAYQTFTATQRTDIKVIMDGKVQDFKDANGNTVYPVIINGTTYLPLRPVAGLMGKDVHWNNDTQTITLGEVQPTSLLDVVTVKDTRYVSKVVGENNLTFPHIGDIGVTYQSALKAEVLFWGTGSVLELSDAYNKLSCSILSTKDINVKIANKDTGIEILNRDLKANEIIELKDLDIKGIKNLDIKVQGEIGDEGVAYFLNPIVE